MKHLKYILLLLLVTFTAGCARLDDNFFNLTDKITAYQRDNYKGEQDFMLDENYQIPDSLIHEFTLRSKTPGEEKEYKIYATYIGDISKIATDTVIMYCHGNKWHMDFYWQRAKLLANTGGKNHYGVLMIDYRGYGLSEGSPDEQGLYADADAALAWLKLQGLTNERLIMYGFSMGSAPATELTANPRSMQPAKLILEAPVGAVETMVQDAAVLAMPASFVTDLKFDNAEKIKKVQQPFMWIHGVDDDFVAMKTHGEMVYKNFQGTYSEAHRIENGNHGTVPQTWGFENYLNAVNKFITKK